MNKFREYLSEINTNDLPLMVVCEEFGQKIGRSAEAVRRYANGDRTPQDETKQLIHRVTKGKVPVMSWFPGINGAADH